MSGRTTSSLNPVPSASLPAGLPGLVREGQGRASSLVHSVFLRLPCAAPALMGRAGTWGGPRQGYGNAPAWSAGPWLAGVHRSNSSPRRALRAPAASPGRNMEREAAQVRSSGPPRQPGGHSPGWTAAPPSQSSSFGHHHSDSKSHLFAFRLFLGLTWTSILKSPESYRAHVQLSD